MPSTSLELKDMIIRAGAGAGKTTKLTATVLDMAEQFCAKHGRWPRFIVTTFTRKATQELRERLLKEVIHQKRNHLEDFLAKSSALHISTIHGVLGLFLSRFAAQIGLNPQFQILSASAELKIIKRSLKKVLRSEKAELLQELVEVATLAEILKAFKGYADLRCQFTQVEKLSVAECEANLNLKLQKLQSDSAQLAEGLRGEKLDDKWLVLVEALDRFASAKAEGYSLQTAAAQVRELASARVKPSFSDAVKEAITLWRKDCDDLISPLWSLESFREQESLTDIFLQLASLLFEDVWQEKLKQGLLSMSDLENLSLILIQNFPETAELFAEEWDYWLIDEYQDTSPKQVGILKDLVGKTKKFLVGDPQQSIYLFRGARSEVFAQAQQEIENQNGLSELKLENYRSRPELLYFLNDFFTRLSPQFAAMIPKKDMRGISPVEKSQAHFFKTEKDQELTAALYRTQELLSFGVRPEEILVLARQNKALQNYADLAKQYNVPVHVHASAQFFERQEVRDALACLKFLLNPHDNLNLLTVLRSPWFFIGDAELVSITDRYANSYWELLLKSSLADKPVVQTLRTAVQNSFKSGPLAEWKNLLWQSPLILASQQLDPSGRREANLFKTIDLVTQHERRSGSGLLDWLENLEIESELESGGGEGDAAPVQEPARVNLMTVHASKGLQFDHIILLEAGSAKSAGDTDWLLQDEEKGRISVRIPDSESGGRQAVGPATLWSKQRRQREQQEYDRLLYVALTRARESVTLISNSTPEKASWMARVPYSLSDGEHAEENFSYRVKLNDFSINSFALRKPAEQTEKHAFVHKDLKTWRVCSATEILEQQAEIKSQPGSGGKSGTDHLESLKLALKGTEMHRQFENIKYSSMMEVLGRLPSSLHKSFQFVLDYEKGLFAHMIENGFVEWGFGVRIGARLIQGQIDLWGQDPQGEYYVCDYKTGAEKYKDNAFSQLKIYLYALKKLGRIPVDARVKFAVIYPVSQNVHIQIAPSYAEIQQWLEPICNKDGV